MSVGRGRARRHGRTWLIWFASGQSTSIGCEDSLASSRSASFRCSVMNSESTFHSGKTLAHRHRHTRGRQLFRALRRWGGGVGSTHLSMMMTSPIWAHARAREGASTSSQHPAAKTEAYGMLTTVANPAHTTRPNQHPHIPFASQPASPHTHTHTRSTHLRSDTSNSTTPSS